MQNLQNLPSVTGTLAYTSVFIKSQKCKCCELFSILPSLRNTKGHSLSSYHTFNSVEVESFPPTGFS